jgi:eukaryotic-like serine/threonine-protein kinase
VSTPESTTNPDPIIGTVIDEKYALVRLLGRGGMGAVYEGRNVQTHKRVAVKLLSSHELVQYPDLVRRFFQEARAGSVVESEHVVQVFDSGTDSATRAPYMVMELLSGEDLEACMKRVGALPPVTAAKILLQAASGLSKAHALGIVHRDIKPANLFLVARESGDLTVKLLDFGVAKVRMQHFQDTQAGLTRTGSLLGTPVYMSPEQAKGRSEIDARSDVWSLGIVLYELLTGRVPYTQASSLGELIISICTEDIPLLQDHAPWVPAQLAEIVHRAVSRDIEKRFRDAAELRDALAQLLPDGPRLTPDLLISVSEAQRALIATRFEVTDSGILRAKSRDGMAVTQATAPSRTLAPLFAVLAALLVVLLGAGALTWRYLGTRSAPPPPASSGPPIVVLMSSEPPPVIAPRVQSFSLEVSPRGVKVSVDGRDAPVRDGNVQLSGVAGEVRKVKLELEGKSKESDVAVTAGGLVPSSLELPIRASAPRGKPAPAGSKPATKPTPTELGKPAGKLDPNWPG